MSICKIIASFFLLGLTDEGVTVFSGAFCVPNIACLFDPTSLSHFLGQEATNDKLYSGLDPLLNWLQFQLKHFMFEANLYLFIVFLQWEGETII